MPRKYHSFWSEHDKLYPGGSPQSDEWKHLKRQIRARDGGRCVSCGSTTLLHVDHIDPLSRGGSNWPHNLQTLCKSCHEVKTGRPLRDWREDTNRGRTPVIPSSELHSHSRPSTQHSAPTPTRDFDLNGVVKVSMVVCLGLGVMLKSGFLLMVAILLFVIGLFIPAEG
jgi:hypothetical protein